MAYRCNLENESFVFKDLKTLLAKASPLRTADILAKVAAENDSMRMAAQYALADVPLKDFLNEPIIPYEEDEVTRLILDTHDQMQFVEISHLTVGEFRNWLLKHETTTSVLKKVCNSITPEMAAAVSKLMTIQDLIAVAKKCQVVTAFRNTLGLPNRFSTRLQPNHPTDDLKGILVSILDGLLLGSGDAVIGVNPVSDHPNIILNLINMLDEVRERLNIPTQTCVLTHITTTLALIEKNAPVDLIFQSIAGTEAANTSFGINLKMLDEAAQAVAKLKRGKIGENAFYFETGQGSALSSHSNHDVDAQTIEARAYAIARKYKPLLVNSVVGFIGPEYLYNGKQIIRAGLEDHFCGKLLGLPMGCDVCFTHHSESDQDDMDILLTLLGTSGVNFVIGVPGADDIMLNYQSSSFHDVLYLRSLLNLRPAPEFEQWLIDMQIWDSSKNTIRETTDLTHLTEKLLRLV